MPLAPLILFYCVVFIILFCLSLLGVLAETDKRERKRDARSMLWSFIWPVWIVYLAIKWALIGLVRLIQIAIRGE